MRALGWAAALTLSLGAGATLAQSLGEVVEKDKKRREALKGKAKSYGDADLAAKRPTPEPEASPSPAPIGGALAWPTPQASATPAPTPTAAPRTPAEKARASMSAPGGVAYHKQAWDRFSEVKRTADLRCLEGSLGGAAIIYIHITAGGSVAEVTSDHASPYVSCLAEALRGQGFPPPPSGPYWFSLAMQWTAP